MRGNHTQGITTGESVKKTKQAREVPQKWEWTEPSVWTERMLTTLEKGVKGGVWFSLIDKIFSKRNLYSSFRKVKKGRGKSGIDHITIQKFETQLDYNIAKIHAAIKNNTYKPQKILRIEIPKPGTKKKRPLGLPTVRDKVVQTSLRNVIEPIFEQIFSTGSFGFRPGLSCKDALREVDKLLKEGFQYVVDADIKSYFDNINQTGLMREIKEKISDSRVLGLIEKFLKQEIISEMRNWIPEKGTPQGGVISPLLSNIYLNKFDHKMVNKGYNLVRYADDFVILCKSKTEAGNALKETTNWINAHDLELHADKTKIANLTVPGEGFEFLGYRFTRTNGKKILKHWPSKKSEKKFRANIRQYTKRCNGRSLNEIIAIINPILRGWFQYYRHSPLSTMKTMDGWVRMRLRSILRKRRNGKGRGRGKDHNRWPNKFFAERGLFSLKTNLQYVRQSSRR
jgi:RNA-directed DNA polymerase